MPKLFIQVGGSEVVAELKDGSNSIGRQSTCRIPVKDNTLSRLHCEILLEGGEAVLMDKGSRNGTLLNGRKIDRHALKPGDRISIGATVIWYEAKAAAQQAAVPASVDDDDPTPPPSPPPPATRRAPPPPDRVPAAVSDYACWTRPGIGAGRIAAALAVSLLLGGVGYGAWKVLEAPPAPRVDLDNLLARNAGFDQAAAGKPLGWVLRPGKLGDRPVGSVSMDASRGRQGGACLALDKSPGTAELLAECAWKDDLSLARQGAVEASAWTQFEGFSGWAAIKIEWLKGPKGALLLEEYSEAATKCVQWTSFGGTFAAPPEAGAFRVSLVAVGRSGKVLFDDVSVKLQASAPAAGGVRKFGEHKVSYTAQGVMKIDLKGGKRTLSNVGCRLESEKEGATPQGLATEVASSSPEEGLLFQGRLLNPLDFREVPFEQRLATIEGNTVLVYQFRGDALKQTDRFSVVLTLPRVESLRGLSEGGEPTSRVTCASEDGDFALEYLDPARVVSRQSEGRLQLVQTWAVDPLAEDPVFGLRIRESSAGSGPLDPLQRISQLRREKKPGEALVFIRDVIGRTREVPVREKMEAEQRELEGSLKREWADLQAEVFRARLSRQESLVRRTLGALEEFGRQWAGEGSDLKAAQLRETLEQDLAAAPTPEALRSQRILDRARQCVQGGRTALAQVLLQTLLARYPSSAAAPEAQQLLKSLDTP